MQLSKILASVPLLAPRVEERETSVEALLGIRLFESDGYALVVPSGGKKVGRAVSVHGGAPDLFEAFTLSKTPWLVAQNRAVRVNTAPFERSLEVARANLSGEPTYTRLLEVFRAWALGQKGQMLARELVLSAPAELCLVSDRNRAASAFGFVEPVKVTDFGALLWSVLSRQARIPLKGVSLGDQLLLGCPSRIEFQKDFYHFGGQVFAIWSFIPRPDKLAELQRLDIDLLTIAENVGGRLYANCFLRTGASDPEELRGVERTLTGFGKVERLTLFADAWGWDLEAAFRAFVPGGVEPKAVVFQNRFEVLDPRALLAGIVSGVNSAGEVSGDMFLGKRDEKPILVHREETPSVTVVGTSGTGKTTTASLLALAGTPFVVMIHMTSVENEASLGWAKVMGGQVLDLDLPAASDLSGELAAIEKQKAWARYFWMKLKGQWERQGEPIGLPLVLRRNSGSIAQFTAVAEAFTGGFLDAWKAVNQATGKRAAIIFDDLTGIPGEASDLTLGDLPSNLGRSLREEIVLAVNSGKKMGCQVFLTAHSLGEFEHWPSGTLQSLSLALVLETGSQHRGGSIYRPSLMVSEPRGDEDRAQGLMTRFNPRLPLPISQVLGRADDLSAQVSG